MPLSPRLRCLRERWDSPSQVECSLRLIRPPHGSSLMRQRVRWLPRSWWAFLHLGVAQRKHRFRVRLVGAGRWSQRDHTSSSALSLPFSFQLAFLLCSPLRTKCHVRPPTPIAQAAARRTRPSNSFCQLDSLLDPSWSADSDPLAPCARWAWAYSSLASSRLPSPSVPRR